VEVVQVGVGVVGACYCAYSTARGLQNHHYQQLHGIACLCGCSGLHACMVYEGGKLRAVMGRCVMLLLVVAD
jgi:hypothetical protein